MYCRCFRNYTQMDEFIRLKTPVKSIKKDPVTVNIEIENLEELITMQTLFSTARIRFEEAQI